MLSKKVGMESKILNKIYESLIQTTFFDVFRHNSTKLEQNRSSLNYIISSIIYYVKIKEKKYGKNKITCYR